MHRVKRLARLYRPIAELRPWPRRLVEFVVLATIGALVLVETRMLWFFSDDWAFIIGRRQLRLHHRIGDFLWAPHNEHLMAGLAVVYAALTALFGLSSPFPFMLLLTVGNVALTWLVSVLVRRAGARWEWGIVAMVWLGFLGAGNEDIIWQVQIGYVWSLALGLGATLIATRPLAPCEGVRVPWGEIGRDGGAAALFVLGLLLGPITLVTMLGCGLVLAVDGPIQRSWRRGLRALTLPAVFFAWWYGTYGRRFTPPWGHPARKMPAYFLRGTTNSLDKLVQVRGLGVLLAAAAVALLGAQWRNRRVRNTTQPTAAPNSADTAAAAGSVHRNGQSNLPHSTAVV